MLYFHYELPYCGDNYVMLFSSQCSVDYSDFFMANARLRDVFGKVSDKIVVCCGKQVLMKIYIRVQPAYSVYVSSLLNTTMMY